MTRCAPISQVCDCRTMCAVAVLWLASAMAGAQTLRDPTVPPPIVAPTGLNEAGQPAAVQAGSIAVIVRHGVPYLVVGTRLYAKGQKVGLARIERITETEVWLLEAGALRKVQVFGGIERRAAAPAHAIHHSSSTAHGVVRSKP